MPSMRLRLLGTLIGLIFITCLACPILETFDHWDHTAQTGQDSESAFVVLAVCAGAIIAFSSQTIVRRLGCFRLYDFIRTPFRGRPEQCCVSSTFFSVIGQSPPILRI